MIPIKKVYKVAWTSEGLVRLQSDDGGITVQMSSDQAARFGKGERVCLYLQKEADLLQSAKQRDRG